jgi:hypothetical protein
METKTRDLIAIGFLESLHNVASWQAFGKEVFIPFLGPQMLSGME